MRDNQVIQMTPEVMVKNLNKKLIKLLTSTSILHYANFGEDKGSDNKHNSILEIETQIKQLLRKTLITEALNDRYIVAVSGLQGVGKTTLIKQLYDIPDELLPENLGRGEKLPILITEDNVNDIETIVISLENNINGSSIKESKIDYSNFNRIAQFPEVNDVMLEIKVPITYFSGTKLSIALLPGFENRDDYWEELIDHTLISSEATIFVLNEIKASDSYNEKIMTKIINDYSDNKPIFCLTFADQSPDNNSSLIETMSVRLKIDDELDRIISTGTSKDMKEVWIPSLINAIKKYAYSKKSYRYRQYENLRSIINNDLKKILDEVKDLVDDFRFDDMFKELEYDKLLKNYNEEMIKIKNLYKKKMGSHLNTHSKNAIIKASDYISNENKFKKLGRVIIGNDLKAMNEFCSKILELWNSSNEVNLMHYNYSALNEIIEQEVKIIGGQFNNNISGLNGSQNEIQSYIRYTDLLQNDKDLFNNISYIYSNNDIGLKGDYYKTMKLIPVLALEFLKISMSSPEVIKLVEGYNNKRDENSLNRIIDNNNDLIEKSGKIITGIALVLGLDMADGTINTIPALASALGVSEGIAMSLITATTGIIAIGFVAISYLKQVNRLEFYDYYAAKKMIEDISTSQLMEFSSQLDDYFEIITEILKSKLREKYVITENTSRVENLIINIKEVESVSLFFREVLNECIGSLG